LGEDIFSRLHVDEEGRLLLDDVPLILAPRYFIAQLQKTMEELAGERAAATMAYKAGFTSGYYFAEKQSKIFGVSGREILQTYLNIASRRGWGKFTIVEYDQEKLTAKITIQASIAEEWGNVGRPVCHMWRGGIAGILQYIADTTGKKIRIVGKETKCIAKGDPHCEIIAQPYTP